jgi:ADP-ribosylation factor-like protein 3
MLIFANKQDLISALPAEEIEELLNLSMINDRSWTIIACSAKDGEGLKEGLEWLMQNVEV